MTRKDQDRIHELTQRLQELERRTPGPAEAPILAIARDAVRDEITRITRADWLAPYRAPRRSGPA